jgi:REP element-mobilizing transposase RayT
MPRKARVEYEGAIYHVMDRGNRLEDIYRDDKDREIYLKTLGEVCGRCGWLVHAYVLMGNHYHLLIETPEANLSRGMRLLQGIYTIRHNVRHRLRGHLFQGRYKAIVVDGEDATYFRTVGDYIHLNPVRAKLLGENEKLESYRWSSFPGHVSPPRKRPSWLKSEWVLAAVGEEDHTRGRNAYRRVMEKRTEEEREGEAIEEGMLKALRRGWYFGSEVFRETILEKLESPGRQEHGNSRSGRARSHTEREAGKLIAIGLKAMGINCGDLHKLPKGSVQKIAIASVVKQRTVVTNAWIAARLHMGAASRVSAYCGAHSMRGEIKGLVKKITMSI